MATLYESFTTTPDGQRFMGVDWVGQTFTPSVNHIISSVKVKLYLRNAGETPGYVTISIRATTSHLPSGSDLASGSTNGDTLTDNSTGEVREITFSSGVLLLAGTKYAIVGRLAVPNADNKVAWKRVNAGGYSGGSAVTSGDGDTWSIDTADHYFEEYGNPQGSGSGGSILPSDAITRVTSLTHRYGRGTYTLEMNLGEVVADFGLPEWDSKPKKAVPEEEEPVEERVKRVVEEATPYPYTPPEVMQPLYEKEAKRRQVQAEELGIVAPSAEVIRVMVEESDKRAIMQEIARLSRSAADPGISPYARDVLQRAITRKQDELRALYGLS